MTFAEVLIIIFMVRLLNPPKRIAPRRLRNERRDMLDSDYDPILDGDV